MKKAQVVIHLITKMGVQILLSRVSMFLIVLVKRTSLSIKTVLVNCMIVWTSYVVFYLGKTVV